ncbi:MAG TPA: glycosyltransferase, partial [Candidatus Dormibacteraeota bacterium]
MSKPVRVLTVVGSLLVGGAERYLARVSPRLLKHGVEVEICTLERVGPLVEVLEASNIPVHNTSFAFRRRQVGMVRLLPVVSQTISDVSRLIRRGRYDAVHSYLFFADVIATAAAKMARARRMIESRRALHAWRHDPNFLEHSLELSCNVLSDELIANSQAVMRDVEEHERWVPRRRTVIYNGIEPDEFRLASPRAKGRLRMITVGALAPRKGQEYALEALKNVRDAGVEAELTLVGSGPDAAMLGRRSGQLGITEYV